VRIARLIVKNHHLSSARYSSAFMALNMHISRVRRVAGVVTTANAAQCHESVTEAEFTMNSSEHTTAPTLSDEVRRAFQSVPGKEAAAASAMPKELERSPTDTVDSIRRMMLPPQGARKPESMASSRLASRLFLDEKDRAKIDAIFACLAICAEEERRAIAFGSREGVAVTQRCIYSIKTKFGIS
jgi:hypothetical protein